MSAEMPRTLKVVTVWLLLGLAVFLGILWWQHRQQQVRFHAEGDLVEIRRGPDGHYHWPGSINGTEVDFLIDTGATGTAISASLARELALKSLGAVGANTAGGRAMGQLVQVDLVLQGGFSAEGLRVLALPGLDERPLLGMDVLSRLRWQQDGGVFKVDLRPPS